jgi:hypothetical protein
LTGHVLENGASWRDVTTGVEERACFLPLDGGAVMVHTHQPASPPNLAVAICSPTDRQHMRHYRRDALIGRSLAQAGVAAVRFDYRGTGNSDFLHEPRSLETMEADLMHVSEWFCGFLGVPRLGFVAEGLSSLPVARVSQRYPGSPVALVEPVGSPRRYYRHLQRTRLVAEARDGGAEWPLRRNLAATLEADGWADILGYRLDASAYRSAVQRDLVSDFGTVARPILVVQLDKRDEARDELAELASRLSGLGFPTESAVIKTEHAWWHIPDWEPEIADEENERLVPALTEWFISAAVSVPASG